MKVKTIETERLILREFCTDDKEDVYEYAKNPNVGPHAGWKPHDSKEESKEIIETLFLKSYHCFAMVFKETNKVIGSIGFEADGKRLNINCMELGYSMSEEFWGKGLMTEAAFAVLEYGFKRLKLERVSIYKNPDNHRSGRIIEKCGFVFEGTLRGSFKIYDGTLRDVDCFSLTKKEYKKLKSDRQDSYAYLLRCSDGSLYGGFTVDLEARVATHNNGEGAKYTKSRRPVELAYYEKFTTCSQGRKREVQLKKLTKSEKEALVKGFLS